MNGLPGAPDWLGKDHPIGPWPERPIVGPAVCCTGLGSRPCPGRTPGAHPPLGRLRSWSQPAAFLSSHPLDSSVLLPAQPGCESWGHHQGGAQEEECVSWKPPEQGQGREALREPRCPCRAWRLAFAHPEQLMHVPSCWEGIHVAVGAAVELAGVRCGKGKEFLVLRTQTLLATYT